MTGHEIRSLIAGSDWGPWIFRLLLLCGILWTQLTYVPRSTYDHFVETSLHEQEKRTEVLADIKEKIARVEERQRIRLEREGYKQ